MNPVAIIDSSEKGCNISNSVNGGCLQPKQPAKQFRHASLCDPLTNLPNRTFFIDRLTWAVGQSKSQPNYQFAVLFLDLDRFKVPNDSLGHLVGDGLLIGVAQRLQACLCKRKFTSKKSRYTLSRLGGDEFAILLENIQGVDDAKQVAEQIQKELLPPFHLNGHVVFISASIGITLSVLGYNQQQDYLRDAEIAMYQAKALDGVNYQIFAQQMHLELLQRLHIENDLRRTLTHAENLEVNRPSSKYNPENLPGDHPITSRQAKPSQQTPPYSNQEAILPSQGTAALGKDLQSAPKGKAHLNHDKARALLNKNKKGEQSSSMSVAKHYGEREQRGPTALSTDLLLYYQPIVSLITGKLNGFEALVRWQHPHRGMVYPGEFIPVVEETSLILPLGLWVLREACRQMRQWHLTYPDIPLTVSVNLSTKQLMQPNLIDQIDQILEETGLEGRYLKLEITETQKIVSEEFTNQVLQKLRQRQIGLYLDDFGTGYSSLSRLHCLPVDTLKIDRSFINELDFNNNSWKIVSTILALADTLGMEAIAEGVETAEQATKLQELNCRYAQGFFFSRPLDTASAEAFIGQWGMAMLTSS